MTEPLDLDAMQERHNALWYDGRDSSVALHQHSDDFEALIAEVRRLRGMLNAAEDRMMQALDDNAKLRAVADAAREIADEWAEELGERAAFVSLRKALAALDEEVSK